MTFCTGLTSIWTETRERDVFHCTETGQSPCPVHPCSDHKLQRTDLSSVKWGVAVGSVLLQTLNGFKSVSLVATADCLTTPKARGHCPRQPRRLMMVSVFLSGLSAVHVPHEAIVPLGGFHAGSIFPGIYCVLAAAQLSPPRFLASALSHFP